MTQQLPSDIFTYTVPILGLAAGTTAPAATLNFDTNTEFKWMYATYAADIAAAGQQYATRVVPLCTVLITDNNSSQNLMNGAVPVPSLFGHGESPYLLPMPRTIPAKSSMTFVVANYDAANTYNLYLQLHGIRTLV